MNFDDYDDSFDGDDFDDNGHDFMDNDSIEDAFDDDFEPEDLPSTMTPELRMSNLMEFVRMNLPLMRR